MMYTIKDYSMPEKYTPEEIANFTESRITSDAGLIEHGAHFEPTQEGESVLRVTNKQIKSAKNEHPSTKEIGEKKDKTEVLRIFTTSDQAEEIDFKEFLDKGMFNSYYRSNINKEDPFQDSVYENSKPFNGIKGKKFQEIIIKQKVGERAVLAERGIKPISLNEWRYLFTQLTEEQLREKTYYLVQFDDGVVRSIESSFEKSGGGPYGFSLSIKKLSPQESFYGDLNPRFITPLEEEDSIV